MRKETKIWLGILVVVIVVLVFLETYTGNTVKEDKIVIGSILPLTGDLASMGQNNRQAIELAVEEINAEGGINGKELEVIFEDGKCNAKDAADAANKLVNIDGVQVIIGGVCSGETMAAAPIVEEAGVVLFSPGSSAPTITDAGDYIFRDYLSDTFQGKYASGFAYDELGKRRVAIIYTIGDYGIGVRNSFKEGFEELGGQVVVDEGFDQTTKDLRTQLTKVKRADPDLIYFVSYTEAAIIGLKQAKELGIEVDILAPDAWDDPKIFQEAKNVAEGAMFTVADSPLTGDFKESMKEKTGSDVITVATPQAYDAVYIIAEIMEEVGNEGRAIKNALYEIEGYEGVSGTITIDENGDLTSGNYAIKVVRDGEAVLR